MDKSITLISNYQFKVGFFNLKKYILFLRNENSFFYFQIPKVIKVQKIGDKLLFFVKIIFFK